MGRRLFVRLGALVAGSALLFTGTAQSQPHAEAVDTRKSDVIDSLPKEPFDLDRVPTPGGGDLPLEKTTMTKVFEKANRKAKYGKKCKVNATNGKEPAVRWCFNPGDTRTKKWMPQGVSSDADAHKDEEWNGHKGLMVSWYSKGKKGVRVTLLNTRTKKYRHILLVQPDGEEDYKALTYWKNGEYRSLHAGGMVWYGHNLYLVDTNYGIRVFSLKNIYDLKTSPNGNATEKSMVGNWGGTFYGHGYRYVIPQVARWESEKPWNGKTCEKNGPLRHSWLSLDRASKPDRLIAGEYCKKAVGRVVAWAMKDGKIANKGTPVEAFRLPRFRAGHGNAVQGGLKNKIHWFFNSSRGKSHNGKLYRFFPAPDNPSDWLDAGTKTTPIGPEDLTYRYRGADNKQLLYSVAEYPKKRLIYARNAYGGYK